MLKKLGKYMKGLGFLSLISALGMIIEAVCELALPSLANNIYETVNVATSPDQTKAYVLKMGFCMLGLAVIGLCGGLTTMKASAVVSQRFAFRLRNDVYKKISNFSFRNIDKFSTASLTTRLTNDITMLQQVVMMSLRILVRGPALLIVAAVMAVRINPEMSATLLIKLPIIIVIVALIMKFGFPMFQKMQKKVDNVNRVVQENLIGMRVVKAFVREDYEIEKFHGISRYVYDLFTKAEKIVAWNAPVMQFTMYTVVLILVAIGSRSIVGGTMEVGELTSVIVYALQIIGSLMMVTFVFVMIMIAEASTDRIVGVLDEVPEMQDQADAVKNVADGSIDFDHVDFSYGGEGGNLSLKDINLHIKSGQTVGIIGGTGSAKSTLVQMIPRLYDVTGGSVKIGRAVV